MYAQTGVLLSILLAFFAGNVGIEGKQVPPLMSDDSMKKPTHAAECTFGNDIRELGSTWHVDLGETFGIMYCIICECRPIQKKRQIVGKVQCKNIKNECPKINCDEPVLLPGHCCKSCPGEYTAEIVQDVPVLLSAEEEERRMKHFGTLVSGRTCRHIVDRVNKLLAPMNNVAALNYVATGRFTFHRKNLFYSFYLSASTPRPRSIQFINDIGNILEEQIIDPVGGIYQNATGKLCGVWRRVPRDYRKLLRDEKLYILLLWDTGLTVITSAAVSSTPPSGILIGKIAHYQGLSTEQFSSLLEPTLGVDRSLMYGSAATAIVSVSSMSPPSIHVSIVFNGLFLPNDFADVPLTVVIEHLDKDYTLLEEEIIIKKPSNDINLGQVRSTILAADHRLLSRGKLSITIASKKDPQALKLRGNIGTRATCDIYRALLPSNTPKHCGLAWGFLDRFGALKYGVKLIGFETENPSVTLVDDGSKRKVKLEDLTPTLIGGSVANGSLEKPGPKLLELLFKGELAVDVALPSGSLLFGRLVHRSVTEAKDTSTPILMQSLNSSTIVGMVWLAIDSDCIFHYELEFIGVPESTETSGDDEDRPKSRQLYLETMPMSIEGAPVSRKLLEEFDGNILDGSIAGLSRKELFHIDSGTGFLEVVGVDKNITKTLLRAQFKTRAPLSCLPHYADNDVASELPYNPYPPGSDIETTSCFHETKFYKEGIQWTASSDPCSMCNCQWGEVKCDPVPCPPLNCPSNRIVKAPVGHCCPICMGLQNDNITNLYSNSVISTIPSIGNNSEVPTIISLSRGCILAGQFHLAGASWHPYLPPSGFDTCAICTCDPINLEVRCPRVQCPPLNCDEKIAARPDKKACCKQCPIVSVIPLPGTQGSVPKTDASLQDQGVLYAQRTAEDILADGGCKYPVGGPYDNGQEWHPKVASHGEIKYVKCHCKDGLVRCDRTCTRSLCKSITDQLKLRKPISDSDKYCISKCRRPRRHRTHNRDNDSHKSNHHHQHNHHNKHRTSYLTIMSNSSTSSSSSLSSSSSPKTTIKPVTTRDS